jgi:hypothetical protein
MAPGEGFELRVQAPYISTLGNTLVLGAGDETRKNVQFPCFCLDITDLANNPLRNGELWILQFTIPRDDSDGIAAILATLCA